MKHFSRLGQLLGRSFSDPYKLPLYILQKIYLLILLRKKNIKLNGKIFLNGLPIIDIKNGSDLLIGRNVTLNSRNRGYHVNLFGPVKIMADQFGAVIKIGDGTRIHGACIHSTGFIEIGSNCLIAGNCQIFDSNGHELSFENVGQRINTKGKSKPIKIGDNVWIGANSIILPGVEIGSGSVIGANSVVSKSVPPMCLAAGNPAKIIKDFSNINEAVA